MSLDPTTIPDDLLKISQQVEEWRSAHPPRSRLPGALWAAATDMAQRHGLHRTAKALHMDYMRLKKRLARVPPQPAPPAFLELMAAPAGLPECVVELESPQGKLRVAMKGMALDWAGLPHAWREAEA